MRTLFCALTLCCVSLCGAESAIDEALDKKVDLTFRRTPLIHVLDALQKRATGLNLAADSAVLARPLFVSLTAENMAIKDLLAQLLEEHGLATSRWAGALVLHLPDAGPKGKAETGKGNKALDNPVSVTFMNLSALETIDRLRARYKLNCELTTRGRVAVQRSGARVRLRLRNLPLRHVLDHLSRQTGLMWELKSDAEVVIDAPRSGDTLDFGVDTLNTAGNPTEDLPKLLAALKRPAERSGATRRLLAMGEDAAQPLADALADERDPDVTRAVLNVLGQVGNNAHHAPVLKVFRDPRRSLEERVSAGQALGTMKAEDAIPSLIAALDHTWFSVSETARQALVKIGGPVSAKLAGYYRREIKKDKAREGLIYRGLLIFGQIGDDTSRKVLLEAIKTDSGLREVSIKHHAAIGLGLTGDVEVVEPLIEAMSRAEEKTQGRLVNHIARSLTWLTDANNAPRALEWRGWWEKEKARIQARIARRKELKDAGLDVDVQADMGDLRVGKDKDK